MLAAKMVRLMVDHLVSELAGKSVEKTVSKTVAQWVAKMVLQLDPKMVAEKAVWLVETLAAKTVDWKALH